MKLLTEFTVTFLLLIQKCTATATQKTFVGTDKYNVTMLTNSAMIEPNSPMRKEGVDVYCYPGATKSLIRMFQTVKFHVHIRSDDFRQYIAGSPAEVYAQYVEDSYGWSLNPFSSQRPKSFTLDPFNKTCLAVSTKEMHKIELQVIGVDLWRVLIVVAGLMLFFMSRTLSGNPLFFYLCGVVVGVCASFMVLVYYVSKLCPRKMLTYGVMIGGWTVGAFILQQVWSNVSALALSYRTHAFWYTLVVSAVSFAVCYRVGPPKDQRSKNLVMWVLQLIGLLLVFFSSNYQEASAAIVITSLTILYFPQSLKKAFKCYWFSHFPPKRRLLTNEEYYAEGAKETKHALDNLREYCKSPDCAQWRIVGQLNDSKRNTKVNTSSRSDWKSPDRRKPKPSRSSRSDWKSPDNHRFASFVEGDSHLNDDEVMDYEEYAFSLNQGNVSNDDSSSSISNDED